MAKKNPYDELCTLSRTSFIWNSIHHLLDWDQEIYMPPGGVDFRASQNTLIATHTHKQKTSPKFKKLLDALEQDPTLSSDQKAALRAWKRDFHLASKLPSSFVKTLTLTTSKACPAWAAARKASSFKLFAPHLEKIVKLSQKKAAYLGYAHHPYDALLDQYEPGSSVAKLTPLFNSLKTGLQSLLTKITSKSPPDRSFLKNHFDPKAQFEFGKKLLLAMGFKTETSRLDLSSHPFCTGLHQTDIRMTTRVHEDDLMSNIFSVIHEGGHGLYAQGLPSELYGTPLGEQASLGMDESQSRFWETRIGRTRPFWHHFLPQLKHLYPSLQNVALDQFYAAINTVTPSFIRVEADEVTYSLHVILRFEIEKLLMEGGLKVKEIPDFWNQKMEELLGITPPNDALGCLQDIHWAFGSFGYFPTYVLGNLYAAQFFETFAHTFPDWEERLSRGELDFVREWLKSHIHSQGRRYLPHELVEKVTGKPFSEKPYINYLNQKYQKIYSF